LLRKRRRKEGGERERDERVFCFRFSDARGFARSFRSQYPPGSVDQLAQRVVQSGAIEKVRFVSLTSLRLTDFSNASLSSLPSFLQISADWRIPKEIAYDLAKLSLFDMWILVDDSGSMAFEENVSRPSFSFDFDANKVLISFPSRPYLSLPSLLPSLRPLPIPTTYPQGDRIVELRLILQKVAFAASLFDADGISVRFLNSRVEGNNITNEQAVTQLLGQVQFSGLTPVSSNSKKVERRGEKEKRRDAPVC